MDRVHPISIIAHRGKTARVTSENTLEAFRAAIPLLSECDARLGIPQIEFDVRMTQDGYLISYHDRSIAPDLDRPKQQIEVADLTYDRLQAIARSRGFEVPLFEDILKLCCNRIALDIEIKEEGYEDRIVALATQYLNYPDFVIKSFNDTSVRRIKDLDPQIKVGLLLGKVRSKSPIRSILSEFFPEQRIFSTGADFVAPHFRLLKFGFLWRMQVINKEVYVWTVNEERKLSKLLRSRYIAAIITDKPELALNLLYREHRQNWQPSLHKQRLEN